MFLKETPTRFLNGWTVITNPYGGVQMVKIIKATMTAAEKAMLENAIAKEEENKATIDYNIMMGNLEDPSDEEEEV